MQGEMLRTCHGSASQDGLKLAARFQSLHLIVTAKLLISFALGNLTKSDCQTLAALGAAGIDHSTAAAGFHANQEAVSAGAANLGGLVSAFHFENPKGLNEDLPPIKWGKVTVLSPPAWPEEPAIIANFPNTGKGLHVVYHVTLTATSGYHELWIKS